MMRFPLFPVAAVLLAAVPADAQISLEAKLGRHLRGSIVVQDHGVDHGPSRGSRGHRDSRPCPPPAPRGHWETVHEQVLVPGYWKDEHVPATYGWIYSSCGHRHWGLIDRGGCRRVWVPDRWETRCRQVWVPACR
ncbi:MAG: hypothetical protein JNK15_08000 [Planctomycetes bacterium]|nr:hypothetical protein [Planctomycetota bacterium]